jgi:hypothetical protein
MNKVLQQGCVCSETNVVLILSLQSYFMTCVKKGTVMCREFDDTCTMMVSDFFVRSVLWSLEQQFVFFTCNHRVFHLLAGSIERHRIIFFAPNNVLQNLNLYSEVRFVTDENVIIVFYSLV